MAPISPYPLVDFPVFGLGGDWGAGRWLEMIEGSSTEISGLTLGHGSRHRPVLDQPWAWLTSWRLRALDRWAAGPSRSGTPNYPRLAAEHALMRLFYVTTPRLSSDEERIYANNTHRLGMDEASRYIEWPSTYWSIDGEQREVHIFTWANAWTGFTVENEVALVLTAVEVSPDRIHLERLTGASAYNLDLRQPLLFPASIIASQQHAPVRNDEKRTDWPRHVDHEVLLAGTCWPPPH